MESYFQNREPLKGLVLVMDIRHPLREFDLQMLHWSQHNHTPVHILLTKADKLSKGAANSEKLKVISELRKIGFNDVEVQLFSSLKRSGIEPVMQKMDQWLNY